MNPTEALQSAVALALSGEWEESHKIVQAMHDPTACWIHAVLHKMEGDEGNSRYWYAKSGSAYEDFLLPEEELAAIARKIEALTN